MSSEKHFHPNKTNRHRFNSYRSTASDRSHNRPHDSFNDRNNPHNNPNLTEKESQLVYQGRDELFDKHKTFSSLNMPPNTKSLLSIENLFQAEKWKIDRLMQFKEKLNDTRNRLNQKDIKVWKEHTRETNMTGRVVWGLRGRNSIEMCTNAWIKMAEIICKYPALIPRETPESSSFRTMHVCEAPGAFICATHFYVNKRFEEGDLRSCHGKWDWTGFSLNPYYEGNDQVAMVDDDRFIIETMNNWYFGRDNSGNILDVNNIKGLWNRVKNDSNLPGVHLVTGDGSVDTSGDPNEQESIVAELHYAEAICAMGALMKGGSLVLKMFNLFECETICLLYVLALHFERLSIFKPASSRAPNGETYIIAERFRGIDPSVLHALLSFVSPTFPTGKALLPLDVIPSNLINELIGVADYFTQKQIDAIQRNLELEKIWNRQIQEAIFQLNSKTVHEFRRRCSIDYNCRQNRRIVTQVELDGSAKALGNSAAVVKGGLKQREGGTLEDRQSRKRVREEFLLNDSKHDETPDREDNVPQNKRKDLRHSKTVVVGQDISSSSHKSSTEISNTTTMSDHSSASTVSGESWAMKMMKKAGFVEGQGLGAHGQGRATPVETIVRDTRLGLGHHNQPSTFSSSTSSEVPTVFDEPFFTSFDKPISCVNGTAVQLDSRAVTIGRNPGSILSSIFVRYEELESLYRVREEYISVIEKEDPMTIKIFLSDQLERLSKDRQHRNRHGCYQDYISAFQLASLDKMFQLTSFNLSDSDRLIFIIDQPSLSGFAEYLVWQQQEQVNGLILSAQSASTFNCSSVIYQPQIDPHHPKVHLLFCDLIKTLSHTKRNQRYVEQHYKREFIIACRRALVRVRPGGHFICKLCDTLTRFTAGLIYLLYHSYESICLVRPFTLDPSCPERFLVCHRLKHPIQVAFVQHLDYLLQHHEKDIDDVLEIVPFKCLVEPEFQQYLADSNQRLIQREIQALNKRLWYHKHQRGEQIEHVFTDEEWREAHELVTVSRREKVKPAEPDSGIQLPPGWIKVWSKTHEQFYYFNGDTGDKSWDPPKF